MPADDRPPRRVDRRQRDDPRRRHDRPARDGRRRLGGDALGPAARCRCRQPGPDHPLPGVGVVGGRARRGCRFDPRGDSRRRRSHPSRAGDPGYARRPLRA
ncbi:MAG: hypothetical protein L0221_06775 [Chloroflexi bacterium]|nr:hypothetical protein [Chloroflexota bacterium]